MRLTIIPGDKTIGIDGQFLLKVQQNLDWISTNIHAVQWYNTFGEVEYNDGTPNERIEELGVYEQAVIDFNNEKQRIEIATELDTDGYWEELRSLRDQKLIRSDWTQISDSPLSEQKKEEWSIYRQALRELPENITEPKPLVLDLSHPNWPVPPLQ
jgi:hypothetical protein